MNGYQPGHGDKIEYHPETNSHRVKYSPAAEVPSEVVVMALEAITNRSTDELDPLYDAIDPDALDGLFHSAGTSSLQDGTNVKFHYNGFGVHVRSSGIITVQPVDESNG